VAFIGLSQFNVILLKRFSGEKIIRVALTGQVIVSLTFMAGAAAGWYGLGLTIFFLFLFLAFMGFTYPNAAALALAPFDKNAGTASSLLGMLQLGVGALASIAVSAFMKGTSFPMAAIIAVSSVIALLILLYGSLATRLSGSNRSIR